MVHGSLVHKILSDLSQAFSKTSKKPVKDIFNLLFFSAKDWDEFICQIQQKFNLQKPVMKNYRIDYQIKDKDGKPSKECYDLTQDDEFQYALTGIG